MDKEQLIKLAVVAGYEFREAIDESSHSSFEREEQLVHATKSSMCFYYWYPHKNIAQAFEVLEGWDYSGMKMLKSVPILVSISRCVQTETHFIQDEYEAKGETLPEAICNAVLKATEQG